MSAIKVNLDKPLFNLDGTKLKKFDNTGTEVGEETMGKVLASYLVSQSQGEALKYYDWAVTLYKGDEIQVDKADFNKIKKFVEDSQNLYILSKAQILKELELCEKV